MGVAAIRRWLCRIVCAALGCAAALPGAPRAYVANRLAGTVAVVDAAARAVVGTIDVGPGPMATALDPDGRTAYVTVGPLDDVAVIDTAAGAVVERIPVGDNPTGIDISPDGLTLYVVNTSDRSLSIVDTATRSVTATLQLGNHPCAVTVHPDGRAVYVAGDYPGGVSVIDAATRRVARTVALGTSLGGLVVSPDGTRLYVANPGSDTLAVLDTATYRTVRSVAVGRIPVGVAAHPDGSTVFVTNVLDEGVISVIDADSGTVVDTIRFPAPIQPQGIAVDPSGALAFVAARGIGRVLVLDTATRAIVGYVDVGGEPTGFGRIAGWGRAGSAAAPSPSLRAAGTGADAEPPAPAPRPLLRGAGPSVATAVPMALMPGARVTPDDTFIFTRKDCLWTKSLATGIETPITGRPDPQAPEQPICDDPRFLPLKHAAVNRTRDRIVFVTGEDSLGPPATKVYVIDLPSRTVFQVVADWVRVGYGGVEFSRSGDLYVCGVPTGDPERPEGTEDSEVFRIYADLSGWEQVTRIPNRGVADMSLSEDGTKIAFGAMVLSTGNVEIAEADLDGSHVRVVIQGGRLWLDSVHDPEHSSDSGEIVYSRIRVRNPDGSACGPNGGELCQELYRQRAGGSPRRVTPIGDTSVVPDWQGTVLLYHLRRGTTGEPGSWIGTAASADDGTGMTPLATDAVYAKFIPAGAARSAETR